jgi:hypothetical protein
VDDGIVVVGTSGGTSVVIRDVHLDHDGFGSFTVELHGAGLDVANGVITYDGRGNLDSYFADLAEAWRGWNGVMRWDSIENDLTIETSRVGGQNLMRFTTRCGHPPVWWATLELLLEPGEQASRVASDLRLLFDQARRVST